MKKLYAFILCLVISGAGFASGPNFSAFSWRKAEISTALLQNTPEFLRNHPEFGILPAGSPCKDCYEEISERTATTRMFVLNGSEGRHFFTQQSLGDINFLRDGNWLSIDHRLQPASTTGVFAAMQQPNPVTIDLVNHEVQLHCSGSVLVFNRNIELAIVDEAGNTRALGVPDWTHFSAGDDGVKLLDFYPGIDVEFLVYEGRVKTNVILSRPLNVQGKWLVMKQGINRGNLQFFQEESMRKTEGGTPGAYAFHDGEKEIFSIGEAWVYDDKTEPSRMLAGTSFDGEQYSMFVSMNWLNNPSTTYPVTLDPLVSASQSMPQIAITGSGYNSTCFTGGCNYVMPTISVPPACTVSDIHTSFSYLATNGSAMKDGGIRIYYNTCMAPAAGLAYTNPSNQSGVANLDFSLLSAFSSCMLPPMCPTYGMNFSMDFFRCNVDTSSGCSSSSIGAASAWVVTVEGHTIEMNTLPYDSVVCTGNNVTLNAVAHAGVVPYTYSWTPGPLSGSTVSVSPASSQTYTCVVTDACSNTAVAYYPVTVTNSDPASVSITPAGPLCGGINMTFTALGINAGSAPSYAWYVNGILAQSGASALFSTISSLSGDSISVEMLSNSTCLSGSTVSSWVVTQPTAIASVTITPAPLPPYCVGQTIVLTASPSGGGPAPIYGWTINNNIVTWTTSNQYYYTIIPGAAKVFRAEMVSSLPCVNNDTVVSLSRSIVGQPQLNPSVSIVQTPPGVVCIGSTVNFTAFGNVGNNPSYSWHINGVLVSNNSSFNSSTIANGDSISLDVTVPDLCSTSSFVSASSVVTVSVPVTPSVTITQVPNSPVCHDDCVIFNANPVNIPTPPSYQWQLNGNNVGSNSQLYSGCSFANGDMVSVILSGIAGCVTNDSAVMSIPVSVTTVDTSVSLNVITLTANALGASYQWLYCDSNMIPVPGATGRSMVAPVNGFFAVSVTQGGCTDTSNCWQIMQVGIDEINGQKLFGLFPNPASSSITVFSKEAPRGNYFVQLTDCLGKDLLETNILVTGSNQDFTFQTTDLAPGLYFLTFKGEFDSFALRFIKQK